MDAQLKSLEHKISQFAALYQQLRADNHQLRQQLALAQNEKKLLSDKIVDARTRLETLLSQIPDEEA